MTPARFGLIGSGWRAEFFLRVAAALPDLLACSGILARNATRREALAGTFGVATPGSLDEVLAARTSWSCRCPGTSRRP
jgi:predicted dehydrogenase